MHLYRLQGVLSLCFIKIAKLIKLQRSRLKCTRDCCYIIKYKILIKHKVLLVAAPTVWTPWWWCKYIETFRSTYDIYIYSYDKTNEIHSFLKFIFGIELYMFRTVSLFSLYIIRSPALYTQQNLYEIYLLLCVQCWTPDDGQRQTVRNM